MSVSPNTFKTPQGGEKERVKALRDGKECCEILFSGYNMTVACISTESAAHLQVICIMPKHFKAQKEEGVPQTACSSSWGAINVGDGC